MAKTGGEGSAARRRCPFCGSRRTVKLGLIFRCDRCGAHFDDDPDEGGDYSDRNPAARLEREEARRRGDRPYPSAADGD